MDNNTLRQTLMKDLDTLKRNLNAVPREILKTKYRKPYTKLCQDISTNATAYVKGITLSDIRIRTDYQNDAVSLIQGTIDKSGLLRQMSSALFREQDITKLDRLAFELKQQIQNALKPFYEKHMGLYLPVDHTKNPLKHPKPYCEVNGCILKDGNWIPLEKICDRFMIIPNDRKNAAA